MALTCVSTSISTKVQPIFERKKAHRMYHLGENTTQCINVNRSMSIAYNYTTALMASQHILVPHPLLEHNSNQTVQSSTS